MSAVGFKNKLANKKAIFKSVLLDCDTLISKLMEKEMVNYGNFLQVWQEMTFSLIYFGFEAIEDLRSFSVDLLHAAKCLWLTPSIPQPRRLAAAYLVWALYVKQPLNEKYQVTLTEWEQIQCYVQHIVANGCYEHCEMFYNLVKLNALEMCAMPCTMTLDSTLTSEDIAETIEKVLRTSKTSIAMAGFVQVDNVINSDVFQHMAKLTESYEEQKNKLYKSGLVGASMLTLTKKNFCQELVNHCKEKASEIINPDLLLLESVSCIPLAAGKKVSNSRIGERRVALKRRPRCKTVKSYATSSDSVKHESCDKETNKNYPVESESAVKTIAKLDVQRVQRNLIRIKKEHITQIVKAAKIRRVKAKVPARIIRTRGLGFKKIVQKRYKELGIDYNILEPKESVDPLQDLAPDPDLSLVKKSSPAESIDGDQQYKPHSPSSIVIQGSDGYIVQASSSDIAECVRWSENVSQHVTVDSLKDIASVLDNAFHD